MSRYVWKLGRFAGIDVLVHPTFWLLPILVGATQWWNGDGVVGALAMVAWILVLFFCVVLHEYGHALTARRFGIPTRDITLTPIGGMARLERMPERAWQETAVALAGPAVNVALAGLLLGVVWAVDPSGLSLRELGRGFLGRLILTNLFLAAFNLVPAFPMDGGRVLRALLSLRLGRPRATNWAVGIGRVLAVGLGAFGLINAPMLVLVAGFVWLAGTAELRSVHVATRLQGRRLRELSIPVIQPLSADQPQGTLAPQFLRCEPPFVVLGSGGEPVGVMTGQDVMRCLSAGPPGVPYRQLARPSFSVARADDDAEERLLPLLRGDVDVVLQIDEDLPMAMVTRESLSRFLALTRALDEAQRSRAGVASLPAADLAGPRPLPSIRS